MPQERGSKVHNKWLQVLQSDIDHKRGWSRRHRECLGQRVQNRLDAAEPKLGPELAETAI